MSQHYMMPSKASLHGRAICRAVAPSLKGADVMAEKVLLTRHYGNFRGRWGTYDVLLWEHDNALVNQGIERILRLAFTNLAGSLSKISHVAVSGAAGAVTSATTDIGSPNSIKAISPNETFATNAVTATAPFDETDVDFAATRLGLCYGPLSTDVVDIIGGGGSAPYDKAFGFDFTQAGEVDLTLGVKLSLAASA